MPYTPPINELSVALTSDFTTASTSLVDTPLTFVIQPNEIWSVMITGTVKKDSGTAGLRLGINAPSGCTIKGFQTGGQAALSTAMQNALITAINTGLTIISTGNNVEVPFVHQFVATNGANQGNITLQVLAVTSQNAVVFAETKLVAFRTKML
jgi:hypothetical protein